MRGFKSKSYQTETGEVDVIEVYYDKLVAETQKGSDDKGAILIRIEGDGDYWLPKSRIYDHVENAMVEVETWLAEQKGLL